MSQDLTLIENPFAAFEDKADPLVPTATLQVYQFINDYLTRGQDTHVNRASSATMCFKRRWYQRNAHAASPLTPRKIVNFLLGDLVERVMQYFVLEGCVGPGKLYSEVIFGKPIGSLKLQGKEIILYEQEDLTAEIGGLTITAHVDGWGKRNSDGKWELIEIKSAANWGFKDFQENGAKDYLKQAHVNLQTNKAKELGANEVRFFFLRKETGHVWDRLHKFDDLLAQEVAEEYKLSNQVEEPKAPHMLKEELFRKKPTGRTIATFPCSYCPYLEKCHGKYTLEFKPDQFGNYSPVYVFSNKEKS